MDNLDVEPVWIFLRAAKKSLQDSTIASSFVVAAGVGVVMGASSGKFLAWFARDWSSLRDSALRMIFTSDEYSEDKFVHLAGNIAEYLYDPEANVFYVAGGSALSATSETWKDIHLVPKRNESTAFSDVGVRLTLIAPEQSAYIQFVNILETVLEKI